MRILVVGAHPWGVDELFGARASVAVVSDTHDALQALISEAADVCLIEGHLASSAHYDVIARMRRVAPTLVIAVIQGDDDETLAAVAGADGHLVAPLERAATLEVLERWQRQRLHRSRASHAHHTRCVLIADDEPVVQIAAAGVLRAHGYQVLTCGTAYEALRILREEVVHILLADLLLPDLHGVELIAAALRYDVNLVAVVMTAAPTVEHAVGALRAGAHDFVAKPVTPERLRAVIDQAWNRWLVGKLGLAQPDGREAPAPASRALVVAEVAALGDRIEDSLRAALGTALEVVRAHDPPAALGAQPFDLAVVALGAATPACCAKLHLDAPGVPIVAVIDDPALEQQARYCGARGVLTEDALDLELTTSITSLLAEQRAAKQIDRLLAVVGESYSSSREIIQQTRDAVAVVDAEARLLFANPAAEELLGRRLGHGVPELRPEHSAAAEGDHSADLEIARPDGSKRIAEVRAVRVPWSGSRATLLTMRDVTEQRKLQREKESLESQLLQAQKLETVGRLAGGIAHDFNNILSVIVGHATYVADALATDDPRRKDVAQVLRAAERARLLTRQLLAFSRRQPVRPTVIDLNRQVLDLHGLLQRVLGENIQIVIQTDPAAARVRLDPSNLDQVLMNLLVNARDAMPSGGTVTISTSHVQRPLGADPSRLERHARIRVRDTGHGMDKATLEHVFEPFFTTKGPEKGTGLGLATCYGIIKQAGGDILIDSAVGQGTQVDIFLPEVEVAPAAEEEPRQADEAQDRSRATVLLVEDEPELRYLLARVLEEHEYRVLEAADGAEALQLFEAQGDKVRLLITDLLMPFLSGTALSEKLRQTRSDLPVLYMSGYDDNIWTESPEGAPRGPLLLKPFTSEALLTKVRELLAKTAEN